jgi:hypothetical protein
VARISSLRGFYGSQLQTFDCAGLEPPIREQLRQEIMGLQVSLEEFVERLTDVGTMKAAKVTKVSTISKNGKR